MMAGERTLAGSMGAAAIAAADEVCMTPVKVAWEVWYACADAAEM